MNLIEIDNVTKIYKRPGAEDVIALEDISGEVVSGEFLSIVGPSGCGKSTLLRMISGLDTVDRGGVLVEGQRVAGPDPKRGFLFQEYALFPWKTVRENVEFGPKARGIDRATRAETATRYIDLVKLTGFEDKYPHELSGGMKQRCALARLLANDPKILLMDEPLAAIDAQTRKILQEDILRIWQAEKDAGRNRTIIWVTHSIDEAVFLSDRIMVMTARPATVSKIITVDLPRPRTIETEADPAFARQCRDLWTAMKDEAEQAILQGAS